MRILALRTLRQHWQRPGRGDSQQPLRAWHKLVEQADWAGPAAVKTQIGSASVIAGNRVVFNVAGNKYRLVVKINYPYRVVYVRFIGTHAEYDAIDAAAI